MGRLRLSELTWNVGLGNQPRPIKFLNNSSEDEAVFSQEDLQQYLCVNVTNSKEGKKAFSLQYQAEGEVITKTVNEKSDSKLYVALDEAVTENKENQFVCFSESKANKKLLKLANEFMAIIYNEENEINAVVAEALENFKAWRTEEAEETSVFMCSLQEAPSANFVRKFEESFIASLKKEGLISDENENNGLARGQMHVHTKLGHGGKTAHLVVANKSINEVTRKNLRDSRNRNKGGPYIRFKVDGIPIFSAGIHLESNEASIRCAEANRFMLRALPEDIKDPAWLLYSLPRIVIFSGDNNTRAVAANLTEEAGHPFPDKHGFVRGDESDDTYRDRSVEDKKRLQVMRGGHLDGVSAFVAKAQVETQTHVFTGFHGSDHKPVAESFVVEVAPDPVVAMVDSIAHIVSVADPNSQVDKKTLIKALNTEKISGQLKDQPTWVFLLHVYNAHISLLHLNYDLQVLQAEYTEAAAEETEEKDNSVLQQKVSAVEGIIERLTANLSPLLQMLNAKPEAFRDRALSTSTVPEDEDALKEQVRLSLKTASIASSESMPKLSNGRSLKQMIQSACYILRAILLAPVVWELPRVGDNPQSKITQPEAHAKKAARQIATSQWPPAGSHDLPQKEGGGEVVGKAMPSSSSNIKDPRKGTKP